MAFYPFAFTAVICGEYDHDLKRCKYTRETGMSFATDFSHAAKIVEEYFGTDLVAIKNLEFFEENNILFLPDAVIDEYRDSYDTYTPTYCDIKGNPIPNIEVRHNVSTCGND